MTKRSLGVGFAVVLAVAGTPVGASAQAALVVAGGATLPLAEYREYAGTGWIAQAGLTMPVSDGRLGVGGQAFFGRNGHESPPEGDKSYLWGAVGTVSHTFDPVEGVSPYLLGMVGLLVESFRSETQPGLDASEAALALGGGAGVGFPVGELEGYANAWLLNGFRGGSDATLVGLTAGLKLPWAALRP